MTDSDDDETVLDQIAREIGEIVEEQDNEESIDSTAREGEGSPEDMDKRDMEEYDGDW